MLRKIKQAAMRAFHFGDPGIRSRGWSSRGLCRSFSGLCLSRAHAHETGSSHCAEDATEKTTTISQISCVHAASYGGFTIYDDFHRNPKSGPPFAAAMLDFAT